MESLEEIFEIEPVEPVLVAASHLHSLTDVPPD
jgi:hypothetical protein